MTIAFAQAIGESAALPATTTLSFKDVFLGIGIAAIITGLIYIGRKLQTLDTIVVTTNKIKSNLHVVSNFLIKNTDFNPSELQAFSPLQLTPAGEAFIKAIGFDAVFAERRADFFNFIDNEQPKLKYDVETAAIKSIAALHDKDYMNFLKVFLYNNPDRTLDNTAPTLGVYIRDAYLKDHPEITE